MAALRNGTTGKLVAARVSRAIAPWHRAIGYLLRCRVEPVEGLWYERCAAVHTFGLRACIDVVFIDAAQAVVGVVERAPRNRILRGGPQAVATVELGPGVAAAHLRLGDRLLLE